MTVSTIKTIKDRIRVATQNSKIAVFAKNTKFGKEYDAIFDATIAAKIEKLNPEYIGSFYGINGIIEFEKIVNNTCNKQF